jgi:hypothetical protein
MSAPLTKPQTKQLPDKIQLEANGVTCERIITNFVLKIPRTLQWQMIGDPQRATAYDAEQVHRHVFEQFQLKFDKAWDMELIDNCAVFYQSIHVVYEDDEE